MAVTHSLYIEAPPERVFEFMMDPRNAIALAPEGRFTITDIKMTPDGVGTYSSTKARFAGLTFESFDVVTEAVPNQRIVEKSSAALNGTVITSFAAEGSGTRMTVDWEPRSFWRLSPIRTLMARMWVPRYDRVLGKVKETLETAGAPTAVAG